MVTNKVGVMIFFLCCRPWRQFQFSESHARNLLCLLRWISCLQVPIFLMLCQTVYSMTFDLFFRDHPHQRDTTYVCIYFSIVSFFVNFNLNLAFY
jgi:hypothetical protein